MNRFLRYISVCLCITFSLVLFSCAPFADSMHARKMAEYAHMDPHVLDLALKAHAKARVRGEVQSPYLTVIDYSKPSNEDRFWVIDTDKNEVLYKTLVAHGRSTGQNQALLFSNHHGSHKSSIGVFKTGKTYYGRHGYSLEVHGMEKGVNCQAHSRRIVIHGADYVSKDFAKRHGRIGRSLGCPALPSHQTLPIINQIKNGSMIFAYYPDENWLKKSHYIS